MLHLPAPAMHRRRRLIRKVAPVYVLVVIATTMAFALYVGATVRQTYIDRSIVELESKVNLFMLLVEPVLEAPRQQLQDACDQYGEASGVRLTVMLTDGLVVGDSSARPGEMENHASRVEMAGALAGRTGHDVRRSATTRDFTAYVAKPIERDGKVIAVVRAGLEMVELGDVLQTVYVRVAVAGALAMVVIGVVAMYVFHRFISRPLQRLQNRAERFGASDLTELVPQSKSDAAEFATLADVLNAMARQLDEKIGTVTQQAREQQAVLTGMIEGVLAVDNRERVIMLNAAAAKWLDVDLARVHGRMSYEVIRNSQIQDLIARTLESDAPIAAELTLRGQDDRLYLQAQSSPLRGDAGGRGVVVVLHDVTRLRQLETVRQQFVSNVSHELKTPIAAIKAAVETMIDDESPRHGEHDTAPPMSLADGSLVPAMGRERFLGIISRQADRLNAIVEDLLMLARIEEDEQNRKLAMQRGPVIAVLRGAVETCQTKADDKSMAITVTAEDGLKANMNAPLLEQAVVNMLDNAIKYSPSETEIVASARQENGEIVIAVRDQGPGIERIHLPRVFERFYRTDKARSRSLGGTGLGLAIVKHVAQAHGGRVSADSSQEDGPGRGSTFRIHLPAL